MPRLTLLLALLLTAPAASAQGFSFGADFVSRYVWRGNDFGSSASVQPSLAYAVHGTEIGTWASYALVPDGALADEHDLWLSHTVDLADAAITFGVTSYYFPNAGADFFDLEGGGEGAHYLEPFVAFERSGVFPLTLMAGAFVYNDPDHSIYLEAGFPFTVAGTDLTATAGMTPGTSAIYATEGPALINLGLRAARTLPISDRFGLPLFVGYTLNPYAERSYLVAGISL